MNRHNWYLRIGLIICTLFITSYAHPEETRVLETSYGVEVGGERAFNTYLSELGHSGTSLGIYGQWRHGFGKQKTITGNPASGANPGTPASPWEMTFGAGARMGFLRNNPARNAVMDDVDLQLSWYATRCFRPAPGLTLKAGAGALLDGGALYVPRNSNNPVAARAYLGLTLNGAARYDLRLWGRTYRLLDEVSLPTLGVFFSPHYGQSYYEIYLGEHDGLARCGWWGNHFTVDNLLAVEVPLCSIRLRLGYRLQVMNSIASDIHSRITNHSLVLGISTDWINVTRKLQMTNYK